MTRIAHIDGLRALAVMAVLLFHAGLPFVPGGFVGVDVFFVISGFVITRMIWRDISSGSFSLIAFYLSRTRRLYPALLVTISLTIVGAAVFFTPAHFSEFGWSALWAILPGSNVFFWSLAGYFDTAALTKPLLHTWTLSVEWQFYAVWPAFLILLGRTRRLAPYMIAAAGLASFAAVILWPGDPSTIFYWMPFRIFEFAAGALLCWVPSPKNKATSTALTLSGLGAIGWSVANLSGDVVFPSFNALPPVLGAAAVVWSAGNCRLGSLLLANQLMSYLGRISYSVYLIHWPIIVILSYYLFRPFTPAEAWMISAISIGAGALLHHLVEMPMWKGGFSQLTNPISLAVALSLLAVSGSAASDGWLWRLSPEAQQAAQLTSDQLKRLWGKSNCRQPCEYGKLTAIKKVLVMGDSHVDHFARALNDRIGKRTHFFHLHGGSCFFGADLSKISDTFGGCEEANNRKREWIAGVDVVVHAQRWSGYMNSLSKNGQKAEFSNVRDLFAAELADIKKLYDGFDGVVILVNSTPSARMSCLTLPQIIKQTCRVTDMQDNKLFASMALEFVKENPKFRFVNPADHVCEGDTCQVMDENNRLQYVDDSGHLSYFGARRVVPYIARLIAQSPSRAAMRDASAPTSASN